MFGKRFIKLIGVAGALGLCACASNPLEPSLGYCSWGESPASGCLEWVPETVPDTLIWEAVSMTSGKASAAPLSRARGRTELYVK